MAHQFKDSGAKAVVILANFAHNLEKIIHETSIETVVVTEIGDMLGGVKKTLVNFVVKNVKKMVPPYKISGAIKFNSAMKLGKAGNFKKPELDSEDIAYLQYTGGTTGVSKGAMLDTSQYHCQYGADQLLDASKIEGRCGDHYHCFTDVSYFCFDCQLSFISEDRS
jgi:acyl-CoA synthetase (AMP-forming)/AMP-acid ligase II